MSDKSRLLDKSRCSKDVKELKGEMSVIFLASSKINVLRELRCLIGDRSVRFVQKLNLSNRVRELNGLIFVNSEQNRSSRLFRDVNFDMKEISYTSRITVITIEECLCLSTRASSFHRISYLRRILSLYED